MNRWGIIVGVVALSVSSAGAQQMFRWTDKDGKVHYSDKAPNEQRSVEQRKVGGSVIETSNLDYGTQQAAKNFPVSLYTSPDCKEPCQDARSLLQKRGVPFSEIAVRDDTTRAQLKQTTGDTQVPVLIVGREMSRGFEAGMFNSALDSAGYPKQAAPGRVAAQAARAAEKPVEPKPVRGRYSPPQ